jgi:bifunctional UDP-N-acetylglucosamine pyrophosphorylase/glucosamine-1-phosphate N-acetyltransferase
MNPAPNSSSSALNVVILAAGQGKRMRSAYPKVLHTLAGKSMLAHVLAATAALKPDRTCVVYGHGGETVREACRGERLVWAKQEPQLGTGHAVMQAMPYLSGDGVTLVVYGDVPLIGAPTLSALVDSARHNQLAWLTAMLAHPAGLGRLVRDARGNVRAIVEDKDATPEQRAIHEINTGFVACPTALLAKWLPRLGNHNAQDEYYLTDILAMAVGEGIAVETLHAAHDWEVMGVNSREQLAQLERIFQHQIAQQLMAHGVTLADPARLDVRGQLTCETDVSIDVNCLFEGTVHLAADSKIGANCVLRNCSIGAKTVVFPFTDIDGAVVGASARIGPYARIRPGTTLADEVHLGNFVEVKASQLGAGSKANHLSYIGDTSVGSAVNIGAGTIVCNYDGANKHRSVIEDNVHIGSDVQLVAPITVGKGADVAAGTTVWRDVPPGGLTLNPKTQVTRADWTRPAKKK